MLKGQMYFLASDYLAGRRTGSLGNEIVAEYIAAQLEAFGYVPINGESYFQDIPLEVVSAPTTVELSLNGTTFNNKEDVLVLRGGSATLAAEVVFVGYGWVDQAKGQDDYQGLDVKGKIVITLPGLPDDQGQRAIFQGISAKAELAAARGAIAQFELYRLPFPWSAFVGFMGNERMSLKSSEAKKGQPYPLRFYQKQKEGFLAALRAAKKPKGTLQSSGMKVNSFNSRNVGGVLRGSDPTLAEEYLLLSAHFDHVGVGAQGGGAFTATDSIFNGARDNAFGTISLLSAAKCFAEQLPRRSIIVLAVTGEEVGLLGSEYYASHPLLPLEKTVYNFNTDGAGYNDTTAIAIIGMGRTGVDAEIEKGAAAVGLRVVANPVPEQGLFDRSDNVSFAARGVPALTFSPGFEEFDDTMLKYYHQVTDNPNSINYSYLWQYCRSFTYIARLIANKTERPTWVEGDKYQAAGRKLYGGN
ncbi:MAG: M28 family peptidase [Lewinella sp.]|nr:M28 family peptidase [Lewinella sp.]